MVLIHRHWLSLGKKKIFIQIRIQLRNYDFRKTGTEYLEQIQRLLENDNINANMSSYSIFLNLLGKVIKRYLQNDTTNAVMKIIGKCLKRKKFI